MSPVFRLARLEERAELEQLIERSTRQIQSRYYSSEQIEGALGTVFGVDTQLILDQTYYVALDGSAVVGCGGWSKRKTLYGGDKGKAGDDPLRDPRTEPAMIRAFFVDPAYTRRGIGRELLRLAERDAAAAGFRQIEIVATLAGEPLYQSFGYTVTERHSIPLAHGLTLPVVRMRRLAGVGSSG